MSLQTQIPGQLNSIQKTLLVGGFDGHGSSTTLAVARATKTPLESVVIKYPDCSPELAPKLLYSMNLYGADIQMFDIAINVKNPAEWLNMMQIIATNSRVTMYDHHESNLKFLSQLPTNLKLVQFSSAADMAKAIMSAFNAADEHELLTLGVITDRDSSVKELIDVESREFVELYQLANIYDVLIRQNLNAVVQGVYSEGVEYIKRMATPTQYPPAAYAKQLQVTKYDNIIYIDAFSQQLPYQWLWKTWDEVLRINAADYLVAVTQVLDRQISSLVPVVFVVKFWLSEAPSPRPLLSTIIQNRKVIGHDDGFSISSTSPEDARQLAQQIISALQSNFSSSVSLIPSQRVASAIQSDFNKILQKLTEILEEQRKQYAEYLELKREQVELLKKVDSSAHRGAD